MKKIILLFSFFIIGPAHAMDAHNYAVQVAALAGWESGHGESGLVINNLTKLINMGLDLDYDYTQMSYFTYPTLLMNVSQDVYYKELITAKWLIKNGANINIGKNGFTPSMMAFHFFHRELISLYFEHPDFNLNLLDNDGNSHLHHCFKQGITTNYATGRDFDEEKCRQMCDILKILMSRGADPHQKNHKGETPIDLAKKTGFEPFLRILIRERQQ